MHGISGFFLLRLSLIFLGVWGSARADAWTQLKVGMSSRETTALLGDAVLLNQARGFAVAIYDGRAEVVFVRGRLASWTAPASSGHVAPALSAWTEPSSTPQVTRRAAAPRGERSRRPSTLPAYRL